MQTCACCGYQTIEAKGDYEICPICFWEDDPVQEADPWFEGGAVVSRIETRQQSDLIPRAVYLRGRFDEQSSIVESNTGVKGALRAAAKAGARPGSD